MKVLFVNSANKKKRISPFILSQAESLRKNGIQLDLFTLNEGGIKGYVKHSLKLRRLLKKEKYDVIHAHYALMGFISSFARRKEKLIVSLMGCDILGSYRSDGNRILYHQVIVIAARIFAKFFWDSVILKSSKMIPQLIKNTNYMVIPNGVDLDLFKPEEQQLAKKKLGLNDGIKYIFFPTNPERQEKNFPLALNAFDHLKEKVDLNIELLIEHKLTYDQLVIYYNAIDVCIMTSRSEGSPNVIKECMACNLPIVSTDVGDVKEIISETEGCYISNDSPEVFADNILKALNFNNRTSGRENIKPLEINLIAKKIISLYKNA